MKLFDVNQISVDTCWLSVVIVFFKLYWHFIKLLIFSADTDSSYVDIDFIQYV